MVHMNDTQANEASPESLQSESEKLDSFEMRCLVGHGNKPSAKKRKQVVR